MIKDLLANASFLITTLFIGSQLFRNTGLSEFSLIKSRVLLGIIGGVSCITLMYYGFYIKPGVFMDFRNIPGHIRNKHKNYCFFTTGKGYKTFDRSFSIVLDGNNNYRYCSLLFNSIFSYCT